MLEHELLLLLHAHPSPLLDRTTELLHPGERAALAHLAEIASLYARIARFAVAPHPTPSLSALAAVIARQLVQPYVASVIALETSILDPSTGGRLPISLILGEMAQWEQLLHAVGRVLDDLEVGPAVALQRRSHVVTRVNLDAPALKEPGRRVNFDVPPTPSSLAPEPVDDAVVAAGEWTAAPLLSLLHVHSQTGLVALAALLDQAIHTVSAVWLSALTSFLIWGKLLPTEPLVLCKSLPASEQEPAADSYTFPAASLPQLKHLLHDGTRANLLDLFATICLALSVLHGQEGSLRLSKVLRRQLEAELEGCHGPGEETFPKRIKAIETLLSTHLLTSHLPLSLISSHLRLFSETFLLRNPALTTSILTSLTTLQTRVLGSTSNVPRTSSVTNLELATVLIQAGRVLDQLEEDSGDQLAGFHLVLTPSSLSPASTTAEDFSTTLLGPSLSLKFNPKPTLALFLTRDCLRTYNQLWGFLAALKSCHTQLLSTWALLTQHNRLQRTQATPEGLKAQRDVWTLVKSMNWWIETLLNHFFDGVIDPALGKLLDIVSPGAGGVKGLAAATPPSGTPAEEVPPVIAHPRLPSHRTRPATPATTSPPPVLEFATLKALHAIYLDEIVSSLFLSGAQLSSDIASLLTLCNGFCRRIKLGLLERRTEGVGDAGPRFAASLEEFFEHLSDSSANPIRAEQPLHGARGSTLKTPTQLSRARVESGTVVRENVYRLIVNLDASRWFSAGRQRSTETSEQDELLKGLQI